METSGASCSLHPPKVVLGSAHDSGQTKQLRRTSSSTPWKPSRSACSRLQPVGNVEESDDRPHKRRVGSDFWAWSVCSASFTQMSEATRWLGCALFSIHVSGVTLGKMFYIYLYISLYIYIYTKNIHIHIYIYICICIAEVFSNVTARGSREQHHVCFT